MSKNKKQHFVPAFYLYNFTNDEQKASTEGQDKRKTPIYHFDFSRNCVRQRPIEKVAIDSYTLSYENEDGNYDHSLDAEVQEIEKQAAVAINELNDQVTYILKKKPRSIALSNSMVDKILELLFWQIKRHPETVCEMKKECEQYLISKGRSIDHAKEIALKVIKDIGNDGEYDIKKELKQKNKIIIVTTNPKTHFITSDKPFVRFNKTGPNGIAMPKTEMYYPLTSNMLLFMHENGNRQEFHFERNRTFLRKQNTYMGKFASRYLFGPSKQYLQRIRKEIGCRDRNGHH